MKFLYSVESGAVIAHMVRCSGIVDPCSCNGRSGECSCILGKSDQVALSCCSKRGRRCCCIDLVLLIQGTFEVDAVGIEVFCQTAPVSCQLVVPGGICIALSVLSVSACFRGQIFHVPVYAFELLASSFSSPSASAT